MHHVGQGVPLGTGIRSRIPAPLEELYDGDTEKSEQNELGGGGEGEEKTATEEEGGSFEERCERREGSCNEGWEDDTYMMMVLGRGAC